MPPNGVDACVLLSKAMSDHQPVFGGFYFSDLANGHMGADCFDGALPEPSELVALVGMCSSALLSSINICFCLTRCAGCRKAEWFGLTLRWLRTGWVISGLLSDAAIMSSNGNDNVQLIGVEACSFISSARQ